MKIVYYYVYKYTIMAVFTSSLPDDVLAQAFWLKPERTLSYLKINLN